MPSGPKFYRIGLTSQVYPNKLIEQFVTEPDPNLHDPDAEPYRDSGLPRTVVREEPHAAQWDADPAAKESAPSWPAEKPKPALSRCRHDSAKHHSVRFHAGL